MIHRLASGDTGFWGRLGGVNSDSRYQCIMKIWVSFAAIEMDPSRAFAFLAGFLASACIGIEVDDFSHMRVPCVISWLMVVFNDKSVTSQETKVWTYPRPSWHARFQDKKS
jgi:hypothetical protein